MKQSDCYNVVREFECLKYVDSASDKDVTAFTKGDDEIFVELYEDDEWMVGFTKIDECEFGKGADNLRKILSEYLDKK